MTSTAFANLVLIRLEWAVLAYFVLVNSFYAILLLSAIREMGRYRREMWGERHVRMSVKAYLALLLGGDAPDQYPRARL